MSPDAPAPEPRPAQEGPDDRGGLQVGDVVAERYRLEKPIGRGAMGEVWAARHVALGTACAIKFLDRALLDDSDRQTSLERFSAEAKAASALSKVSRHIVQVHDYGEQRGRPYIVMEVLEGISLEERVEAGPVEPEEALQILQQIGRGLSHAHRSGLVHRDLKPGNVFLCRDEDGELLVKVLDFGLVRSTQPGDPRRTERGLAVGTPAYMSPEQARATDGLDARCDVWSMTVVAYELLAGVPPWPGGSVAEILVNVCLSEYVPLSEVRRDLGERFDPFFRRGLARRVRDRYATAEELVEAFRLATLGPAGPPPRQLEVLDIAEDAPPRPAPRSGRAWAAVAGAAALALLVGLGAYSQRSHGSPGTAQVSPLSRAPQEASTVAAAPTPAPLNPTERVLSPSDLPKVGEPAHPPARRSAASPAPTSAPAATTSVPATPAPATPAPARVEPHDKSEVL